MDQRRHRVGRHVVHVILSVDVCAQVSVQFIVAQMSYGLTVTMYYLPPVERTANFVEVFDIRFTDDFC